MGLQATVRTDSEAEWIYWGSVGAQSNRYCLHFKVKKTGHRDLSRVLLGLNVFS